MTDFTGGGIPNLDYDKDDVTIFNDTTEFTNDVFVYGKLYAEFGGDVQSFSTAGVERVRIHKDGQVTINSDVNAQSFNDVNDGGETFFPHQEKKVKARQGKLVIWPSDWTHAHQGIVSNTEKKYITSSWLNFIPD